MRRTFPEILVYIVASVAITIGTAVVGTMLSAPAPSKEIPADLLSGSCLDEPFQPTRGVVVGTLARLCFDVDAVRPRVELTGVTSSALYSGWLTQAQHPLTPQGGACLEADADPSLAPVTPDRFDATIADRTGRVQLSAALSGLRIPGGSEVRLLVVDHGWVGPEQPALSSDALPAWHGAWVHGVTTTGTTSRASGRLIGCAVFRLRGGTESIEN
jgi:hypothetical protein